jgi:hypothetical protein
LTKSNSELLLVPFFSWTSHHLSRVQNTRLILVPIMDVKTND